MRGKGRAFGRLPRVSRNPGQVEVLAVIAGLAPSFLAPHQCSRFAGLFALFAPLHHFVDWAEGRAGNRLRIKRFPSTSMIATGKGYSASLSRLRNVRVHPSRGKERAIGLAAGVPVVLHSVRLDGMTRGGVEGAAQVAVRFAPGGPAGRPALHRSRSRPGSFSRKRLYCSSRSFICRAVSSICRCRSSCS